MAAVYLLTMVGGPKNGQKIRFPVCSGEPPRVITFQGRFPDQPDVFRVIDYVKTGPRTYALVDPEMTKRGIIGERIEP
jgi:hypothetical protein